MRRSSRSRYQIADLLGEGFNARKSDVARLFEQLFDVPREPDDTDFHYINSIFHAVVRVPFEWTKDIPPFLHEAVGDLADMAFVGGDFPDKAHTFCNRADKEIPRLEELVRQRAGKPKFLSGFSRHFGQ